MDLIGEEINNITDFSDLIEEIVKYAINEDNGYTIRLHAGETDRNGQKRIFSTLEILEPGTICTETYMLLSVFDNQNECVNMLRYLKTRFVRALVAMVTATQHLSKANFRFVPLQDFTRPWTDAELYAKYGLTDEEIAFIESMIKPME